MTVVGTDAFVLVRTVDAHVVFVDGTAVVVAVVVVAGNAGIVVEVKDVVAVRRQARLREGYI